jgi:hypothetical protein
MGVMMMMISKTQIFMQKLLMLCGTCLSQSMILEVPSEYSEKVRFLAPSLWVQPPVKWILCLCQVTGRHEIQHTLHLIVPDEQHS